MDTRQFASALDILYTDLMTVYALESVTANDGTTNNVISDIPTESGKCRLSYRKIDTPYQTDASGVLIQFEIKIICGPDVNIKAGDYIEISRRDSGEELTTAKGYAGHPAKYGTHQEVILIHRGRT
jgi:hypothetical protein